MGSFDRDMSMDELCSDHTVERLNEVKYTNRVCPRLASLVLWCWRRVVVSAHCVREVQAAMDSPLNSIFRLLSKQCVCVD